MSPEERENITPRTVMIGGKAFATYTNAKRIVKLVNDVGAVVNTDPEVNNYLKVVTYYGCSPGTLVGVCNRAINPRTILFPLFSFLHSQFLSLIVPFKLKVSIKCKFLHPVLHYLCLEPISILMF